MKWGFLLIILSFLSSCQSLNYIQRLPSNFNHSVSRHVVFDIDWTIVANYEHEFSKVPIEEIIKIGEESYVVNDGIRELIEFLLNKGIKVSFFSGGEKTRNDELLKKIRLSNGKSLYEIAFTIKSKTDLTPLAVQNDKAKFSEKYKKDLTKIFGDLDQIILIEDNPNFFLNEEQKRNLIWIGKTYKHFQSYQEAKVKRSTANMKDLEYIPESFEDWLVARKKFLIVRKNIEEALELEKETGVTFVESIRRVYEKMRYDKPDTQKYWADFLLGVKDSIGNNSFTCHKMFIQFSKN